MIFLYQSNRFGELEPCGCEKKPFGGIDREANAVARARAKGEILWYVDAGNLLGPEIERLSPERRQRKSRALLAMLKEMKLDVFSPGPADYTLGEPFLKELAAQSGIPFVSTNGRAFAHYYLEERRGIRFAFLGLAPEGEGRGAPEPAVADALSRLEGRADFIVALSQLGSEADERLAKRFPELQLIVGADPNLALDEPFLFGGRTLQVDPHRYGYQLGRLEVTLRLPFRGFFSPQAIEKNRARLAGWKARLAADPGNQVAAEYVAKIEREELFSAQEGGSPYAHELIALDEERFGESNSITERLRAYREEVRRAALKAR